MGRNATLFLVAPVLLSACAASSRAPVRVADDPSARSTTAFNVPGTPEEMARQCDVPIYPGASAPDDLSRMPRKNSDGSLMLELVLATPDPPKKVAAYYSKALNLPSVEQSGHLTLVGRTPHKNDVILEIEREGGRTVVRIHSIAHSTA